MRAWPFGALGANPRQSGCAALVPTRGGSTSLSPRCTNTALGAMEGFVMVGTYDAVFIPLPMSLGLHVER